MEFESNQIPEEGAASLEEGAAVLSSGQTFEELVGTEIPVSDYQLVVLQRLENIEFSLALISALLFFILFVSAMVTVKRGNKS